LALLPGIFTRVGTMVNNLQRATVLKHLTQRIEADDPNDSFLLSMSIEGNADYLVTGDHQAGLLKRKKIEGTRILTPTCFCLEVLQQ